MKWFLGLVVALNIFVALVVILRQHDPVDIYSHEVSPEQLKVLPVDWQPGASASASTAASASAVVAPPTLLQTASSPLGRDISGPKAPSAKVEALQCAQWHDLDDALFARIKGGLPSLHLSADQINSQEVESSAVKNIRYWVYVPAQAATAILSAELKEKGFDNYVVQDDGVYKGALSLGLFGKQEGAEQLLGRLKKARYDQAMVLERGKSVRTRLLFKGLSDQQLLALKALQQRLTPGIVLQTVPCEG